NFCPVTKPNIFSQLSIIRVNVWLSYRTKIQHSCKNKILNLQLYIDNQIFNKIPVWLFWHTSKVWDGKFKVHQYPKTVE
ncbi:MAG: hypothetical protein AAGM67_07750, partial [Bacteroidota bacterium]